MATRLLKATAALVVLGVVLLVGASLASAQGYPGGATLTLSAPTVPQGGILSATVAGCPPGSSVHFVLNSDPIDMGTVTADSVGSATISVTIPVGFPVGTHTVTATCGDQTLSANVQVLAQAVTATTTVSSPLPITGSNTDGLVRGGVGLVAVGGLLVVLSMAFLRKSRDAAPSSR